jgi:glyoxylase-like metal-dependent hydrolase (beta-lactamase superfamily II)
VTAGQRTPAADGARAATWEVLAVRYGELASTKADLYYRWGSYGEPDGDASMAYYFWVLRGGGRTILVDTGFDPGAAARRGRTCLVAPLDALHELGIAPEDVDTVVLTHLHYDHTGNLHAFAHAELVVPATELEFWTGPHAGRGQFAPHVEKGEIAVVGQAAAAGRVRLTGGTEQILDGVVAIEVGGHSPGQQIVVVESAGGPVALASDAVHLYDELEHDRPFAVVPNLERMYAAYDVLRELVAARAAVVVPAPDPDVFARHGADAGAGNGVAVRLG